MNDQHPLLKEYTYLNTANHGLVSQGLIDYRKFLNEKMRDEASIFTNQRHLFMDEVRNTIATFMDADPNFTAVIPNFSTGFNILINNIDQKASFLLLENDYPAVNEPVQSRNFKTHYVAIDQNLEENITVVCEKESPDFFCFSMVQYISGIQMDLDFLNNLKKRFPDIIMIADCTQYIGFEEFRFRESGIDIIIASCYKWLHAGDGNGFICVKKNEHILSTFLNKKNICKLINSSETFFKLFEPGHQDMIAFGSLKFAILKAQELGWEKISEPIKELSALARIEFEKRGLLSTTVIFRKKHSSIFNIKGDQKLFDLLLKNNIITSLRGDGIRISFSYFNTEQDLKKLLEVLDL